MGIMKQITDDQVAQAGVVLKAVKQIDASYFNATQDMARGWAQIFARHDFTTEELLGGVLNFYEHETKGRRIMPGNVLEGARQARDTRERTPEGKAEVQAQREARRIERDQKIAIAQAVESGTKPQAITDSDGHEYEHGLEEELTRNMTRTEADSFMSKLMQHKEALHD